MDRLSVSSWQSGRADWEHLHQQAAAALQQSWAYGDALAAHGVVVQRLVVRRGDTPVALAQFIQRKLFAGLGVSLCARGPVWLEPLADEECARSMHLLRAVQPLRWPSITVMSPDQAADGEKARHIGGFRRIITGYSTVRIDLSDSVEQIRAAMHSKWRNRLVAAESSPLRIARNGTKPAQIAWLLEKEDLQRQERAYAGLPVGFASDFIAASVDPKNAALILKATCGKATVAAMMFLIHGNCATYHMGWTDPVGREHSAHNLILWHAMQALKERGLRALDLGGINTGRSAGLARFKIGSGGQVLTFAGSYC